MIRRTYFIYFIFFLFSLFDKINMFRIRDWCNQDAYVIDENEEDCEKDFLPYFFCW